MPSIEHFDQIQFELTDAPTPANLDAIDSGLQEFNASDGRLDSVRPLVCLAKSADGQLLGGVKARSWGQCCEVQVLWVREQFRGNGIGRRLMNDIEAEAKRRGCKLIYLETFSFQAPQFYRRLGFEVACEFRGFPGEIVKHILRKAIG
jgi:GNAT superfamily N-acetyltransferase